MFTLLRNRDFGLLWLAGLISIGGDFALAVALPLHVYTLTGSTSSTALALGAKFAPGVLFGGIAGVFVDRWDRRTTMIVADVLRALFLIPLALSPDRLGLVYAVAALQGTIGLFFSPAESALLPTLVGADKLVAANALNSLNDNLGFLFGPPAGAGIFAIYGIKGVAWIDAASFLGSAVFIWLLRAPDRVPPDDAIAHGNPLTGMLTEWADGLRIVRRDPALSTLFASSALANIGEGVFLTLGLAPIVLDVFKGRASQVGWLGTAQGVGGIIAGLVLARYGKRISIRWLLGGGIAGLGFADLMSFQSKAIAGPGNPAILLAMCWMVVAGVPAVAGGAGRQSLVQTRTDDRFRGRVFGALSAVQGAFMLIGLALGGILGGAIGIVPVLSAGALIRMLGGGVALVFLRGQRLDDGQPVKPLEFATPDRLIG